MSEQESVTEEAEIPEPMPANDLPAHIDGIKVRAGATHWMLSRFTNRGRERLSFGLHPESGQAIMELPVEQFSARNIRDAFGPGAYQVAWRNRSGKGHGGALGTEDFRVLDPKQKASGGSALVLCCPRCASDCTGRFCASCGAAVTGDAPSSAPPPPVPPATPAPVAVGSGSAADLLSAFQAGVQFSTAALQSATAMARADADERIKRYEIDSRIQLERERMTHERAMKEQAAIFDRVTTNALNAETVRDVVRAELEPIAVRLSELEEEGDDELEDDDDESGDDDAPEQAAAPAAEPGWTEKAKAVGEFVNEVASGPVGGFVGKLADRVLGSNANGADNANPPRRSSAS